MDSKKTSTKRQIDKQFNYLPTGHTLSQIGISVEYSTEQDVYRRWQKAHLKLKMGDNTPADYFLEDYLLSLYLHLKSLRERELLQLQVKMELYGKNI